MSSEYTPTTEAIRDLVVWAAVQYEHAGTREEALTRFDLWHAAEIAAAEKRGAEQAFRDVAERVKWSFTGEVHYESLQEHADMIRDDEVDWRKPIDREMGGLDYEKEHVALWPEDIEATDA